MTASGTAAGRRTWFVTGVSSGIGRALAAAALRRGDAVAGTVRRLEEVSAFEALAPGHAHGLLLDVSDTAAVPLVAEAAIARLGEIDIVVNNAGQSLWGAVEECDVAEAQSLFATNLFGPMAVMQAFLPHFRAQGRGWFVNMSSGCGLSGVPGLGVYCASKFALEGLTEALAGEAAQFGVRLMLVEPGAVHSRFISHGTAESARRLSDYAGLTGGGKAAMDAWYKDAAAPEDVAEAVMAALAREEPPFRLIVGEDMKASARAKFQAMIVAAT